MLAISVIWLLFDLFVRVTWLLIVGWLVEVIR